MNNRIFDLYGWNTPNGQKIIIALEEAAAEYRYHPIDISKGEQNAAAFRKISPDGKIPALVSLSDTTVTHFESGAILLYLASIFPALNGTTEAEKALVSSWTFWQVGQLGPLAGQFGRFNVEATATPDAANTVAIKHFEKSVFRCLEVLEKRLALSPFIAGDSFTVADIASLPWIASEKSYLKIYNVEWKRRYPSLLKWSQKLKKRPSVISAFGL